jgi:hypothetical protein
MYYRVAIQKRKDRLNQPPDCQWKSTVLGSLETLVQFLRLFRSLGLDHLRLFSSSSRQGLEEQLAQENTGLITTSVTAARFLHERLILSLEGTRTTPGREAAADQLMTSIAVASHPLGKNLGCEGNGLVEDGMSALERRRLELELGPGGDHDASYRFVLPAELLPVVTWMRLLSRIEHGELYA